MSVLPNGIGAGRQFNRWRKGDTRGSAMNVGIIGLGSLGGALAANLADRGQSIAGYDRDAAALERFAAIGGNAAKSPQAVGACANLIILVVRDEGQIDELLDPSGDFVAAIRPATIVWLASTVSPEYASRLGDNLLRRSIHLLDGPVSGGIKRARSGQLTLILAGDDIAFRGASPIAAALAARVFRVANHPGPASAIKAINQLLTASHIAVAAEALGLAIQTGIDARKLHEIIGASSGSSRMFEEYAPRMLQGDDAQNAGIGIFLKDLEIALDMASANGAEIPMASAAHEVFRRAGDVLGREVGVTGILRLFGPERLRS